MAPSASSRLTLPCSHSRWPGVPGPNSSLLDHRQHAAAEGLQLAGPQPAAGGQPRRRPAGASTLQLRPVPGSPTVVRARPGRATGMLNDAPRPPTEIELSPLLAKLKRSGPRRADLRKAET
jgi:hypothetical protein